MKRLALVSVIVFSLAFSPAKHLRFGGTFIGAMVVEDGIIVGSDSRSTFIEDSGKRVGYVDGMQKIFVQHGAAFAVSGLTSVNDELFDSFVRRNDFLLDRPVDEMLFGVNLWLPFKNSTNVLLISAGFLNGEALICAKNPSDPQVCRKSGYIANHDPAGLRQWMTSRTAPPKSVEAAAVLRQAIAETINADPTVGGPISILYLRKSAAPQWLENPPQDRGWSKVCDLVRDFRKGSVRIVFTNTKDELDRYLNGACPR